MWLISYSISLDLIKPGRAEQFNIGLITMKRSRGGTCLRIVSPAYGFFGLRLALYLTSQGGTRFYGLSKAASFRAN